MANYQFVDWQYKSQYNNYSQIALSQMRERQQGAGRSESVDQNDEQSESLSCLKLKIDRKIDKILGILQSSPDGNAQETVVSVKANDRSRPCELDKIDGLSLASTELDLCNSRLQIPSHEGESDHYFPHLSENPTYHNNRLDLQPAENEPKMTVNVKPEQVEVEQKCSQTSSPIDIKVSEECSNDNRQDANNQLQNTNCNMMALAIRLKYCQSRSEGDADVYHDSRIIEVAEELEEDDDEEDTKSTPPAAKLREIGNLMIDLSSLNTRQGTRTASGRSENQNRHHKQDTTLSKTARSNGVNILNNNEQLTHRSLCSVRSSYIQQTKAQRLVVSFELLQEMSHLLKQIAIATRRESEESSRARDRLLTKITHLKSRPIHRYK